MAAKNSILSEHYFHNEQAAYEFVEARLWPHGPACPKCGVIGNSVKLNGKSTRIGVYKCRENLAREARLMTDENYSYIMVGKEFAEHGIVRHMHKEYVSKDHPEVHTNTIEGFFSVFKRGMKGVYQHCAHNHLHRYLAEFDFRYNNRKALGVEDSERADKLLKGVVGKRLTYQTTAQ